MKAMWHGQVLAESDETIEIEGNQYFPSNSIKQEFFAPSDTHTTCVWKGEASYYNIVVAGHTNKDAAWYYPRPKPGSIERVKQDFADYVAFWRGVEIVHG